MPDTDTLLVTSTHECRVIAGSSDVVSEMWFHSSALDKDLIDHIESVQLFTTAHHQGWIGDLSEGIWSWFELVILPSPGDIHPVSTILSHQIQEQGNDYVDQSGCRIGRNEPFISLLKPGNAIGVRVCAQFPGWQNIASHGRLELVVSKKGPNFNGFSIKNDTKHDISVRVTATGESGGDEGFYTINPGQALQWDRSALQVAFVLREDNGLTETMVVKPGRTYNIGGYQQTDAPDTPDAPDLPNTIHATGEIEAMGDEKSPNKGFYAKFTLETLNRRQVLFVGTSNVSFPFFKGAATMRYAKLDNLSGTQTFSGTLGNGRFDIKLANGVHMTAEVSGGPDYILPFNGSGHWGLSR